MDLKENPVCSILEAVEYKCSPFMFWYCILSLTLIVSKDISSENLHGQPTAATSTKIEAKAMCDSNSVNSHGQKIRAMNDITHYQDNMNQLPCMIVF